MPLIVIAFNMKWNCENYHSENYEYCVTQFPDYHIHPVIPFVSKLRLRLLQLTPIKIENFLKKHTSVLRDGIFC